MGAAASRATACGVRGVSMPGAAMLMAAPTRRLVATRAAAVPHGVEAEYADAVAVDAVPGEPVEADVEIGEQVFAEDAVGGVAVGGPMEEIGCQDGPAVRGERVHEFQQWLGEFT